MSSLVKSLGEWQPTEAGFGLVWNNDVERFRIPRLNLQWSPPVSAESGSAEYGQTVRIPTTARAQIGGSCYAFAVAHLLDIARPKMATASGLGIGFFSQFLYGKPGQPQRIAAEKVGDGGHVRYSLGAILSRAYGIIALQDYPDTLKSYRQVPDVEALSNVHYLQNDEVYAVGSYAEAVRLVKMGIPSVVCSAVFSDIYRVNSEPGYVVTGHGEYIGEHAWVLVGPDLLLTSWGKFGLGGLGLVRISRDFGSRTYERYALVNPS